MNIHNISKEKREVTVDLSADDLVMICNALYSQLEEKKDKESFLQLYSDMMMARDLCQYGHVDDFCLHNIVKCRNGLTGILSEDDVKTFNEHLGYNDLPMAFENPDFVRIYKRIVGDTKCNKILKDWMDKKRD